jgi:hypothetical protein
MFFELLFLTSKFRVIAHSSAQKIEVDAKMTSHQNTLLTRIERANEKASTVCYSAGDNRFLKT